MLAVLAALGTGFDCASQGEIEKVYRPCSSLTYPYLNASVLSRFGTIEAVERQSGALLKNGGLYVITSLVSPVAGVVTGSLPRPDSVCTPLQAASPDPFCC